MQNRITGEKNEFKKHIGYIENGINIDHIPHGNAWYVMKILNLFNSSYQVGVGLNLSSRKLGTKDLIKIENRMLTTDEIDAISLFCVGGTLSVMKDFTVISKQTLTLPKQVNAIIVCPNKRCVSHQHISKFIPAINRKNLLEIFCYYCEQQFLLSQVKEYKFDC